MGFKKGLFSRSALILSMMMTLIAGAAYAQRGVLVHGKVMNQNSEPLPFANVRIESTTFGAVADGDGAYVLRDVKPGTYTSPRSAWDMKEPVGRSLLAAKM